MMLSTIRAKLLLVVVVAFFAVVFAPQNAHADSDSAASELLTEGLEHYKAGKYAAAIRAFRRGYRLDPRPEFLFATAQALRLSGDCWEALEYYQRFLDADPPASHAKAARVSMERCEAATATAGDEKAGDEEATQAPDENEDTQGSRSRSKDVAAAPDLSPRKSELPRGASQPSERKPFYKDTMGNVLLGGGALALAGGVYLFMSSGSDLGAAERDATSYEDYQNRVQSAQTKRKIGLVTLAGGGVLVGSAVYRYITWKKGEELPRNRATAFFVRGGVGFGWRGKF